jgi:two-component system phosphate regulon sensor histidine kinase PhoR
MVDEGPANQFHVFNIVDTIKSSLKEFELTITERHAVVETLFSADNIMINGDEILWQKVFSNLIDNAIKFSQAEPKLYIHVTGANNRVTIEFADDGIGINKDDLPRIFEKFYRSDYYKRSNIQGFGLGLSFVKKVVDMHHATIIAESEPGKGTKLFIEINTASNG